MNLLIEFPKLAGQVAYFLPNWEVLTQDQGAPNCGWLPTGVYIKSLLDWVP